jgi:hypothetical protein
MKKLSKVLLILGVVGLIVGISIYFFKTEIIEAEGMLVKINEATRYSRQGFISTDYYTEIQVEPTELTKPGVTYLLILDTGIMKNEYKVSWEQIEIDLHEIKTTSNKISQDEYTALEMQPNYNVEYFEVKPQHQILYLVPGIVILALAYIISRRVPKKSLEKTRDETTTVFEDSAPPTEGFKYIGQDGPGSTYSSATFQKVESDADFIVDEHGTVIDNRNKSKATEPPLYDSIPFIEPIQPIWSSPFRQEEDFLSKLDKHGRRQAETERIQAETERIKEETELTKEIKEDIRDDRQRRKWGRLWGRPWGWF